MTTECSRPYRYVCIYTSQPDTKSNSNPTTKQYAIVSIQPNIIACPSYPEKFTRDNVVAPFSQLCVVIGTLPVMTRAWVQCTTGTAMSRTVTLRQARQPTDSSSLQIVERLVNEGEPFSIARSRSLWFPPPLFEWKTGKMQDKNQEVFRLSERVQMDGATGKVTTQASGARHSRFHLKFIC